MPEVVRPAKLLEVIEEARARLRRAAEERGGYVARIAGLRGKPLAVVGDIHGDYESFRWALDEAEKEGVLDGGLLVLLGDYVDRGPPEGQVSVVLGVASLILDYGPSRVVTLRGNHEPPEGLEPVPHDYWDALAELYGVEWADRLYDASRDLFDELPHALIVEGLAVFLHGGLPVSGFHLGPEGYLASRREPWSNFVEILWNDPSDDVEEKAPSPRGVGHLFGPRVTERALKLVGVEKVVRGHEPALRGYKVNHGGMVVTLFSRLGAPYYNEAAAILVCSDASALAGPEALRECLRLRRQG